MQPVNQGRLENTVTHIMRKSGKTYLNIWTELSFISLSNNSKIVGTEIGILIILDYLANVLISNEIYICFFFIHRYVNVK